MAPDLQRELVAELLAHVESKRELPLDLPDNVDIPDIRPATSDSEKRVHLDENVLTEGGRAAWAIQELLLISLYDEVRFPDVSRRSRVVELSQRLIRFMEMPERTPLETLPVAERVRLASSADADPRQLRELARAPEVEVRLAVAKNLMTSLGTLEKRLVNDPNAHVRQAAIKNLRFTRLVSLRIGE